MSFVGNLVYEIFYVMYMWSYGHFYKPKWYRITTRWDTKRDLAINVLLCITIMFIVLKDPCIACIVCQSFFYYNSIYIITLDYFDHSTQNAELSICLNICINYYCQRISIRPFNPSFVFTSIYFLYPRIQDIFYFELVFKTRLCFHKVHNTFTYNTIVCQIKSIEIYGSNGITFVH